MKGAYRNGQAHKPAKTKLSSPGNKPSKKRKPTLKTMSIADLLPSDTFPKQQPKKNTQDPDRVQVLSRPNWSAPRMATNAPTVWNADDFPSLAASGATTKARLPGSPQAPKVSKHAGSNPEAKPTRMNPNVEKTAGKMKKQNKEVRPKRQSPARTGAQPANSHGHMLAPPVPRDDTGDEHELLRLLQKQGGLVVQNKGRQRIRPRKKKFTSLKKKVLQERLHAWQELQTQKKVQTAEERTKAEGTRAENDLHALETTTVCLYGFAEPIELQDDDEYEEILSNLLEMAEKMGGVRWTFIPRDGDSVNSNGPPSFVDFVSSSDALAAVACWDGLVLGGQNLNASVLSQAEKGLSISDETGWKTWCMRAYAESVRSVDTGMQGNDWVLSHANATQPEIVLENVLSEDDLEDEECMTESLNDIKTLAQRFGVVAGVRVEREPSPRVFLRYESDEVARRAVVEFAEVVVGGKQIAAALVEVHSSVERKTSGSILLENVLTEDDREDEDCLEESLNDIRELCSRFGPVESVRPENDTLAVRVDFEDVSSDVVQSAVKSFNGMQIGGSTVSASAIGNIPTRTTPSRLTVKDKIEEEPTPMFSGDKQIPERFAAAKRVPKVPNAGTPRKYATLAEDDTVKPLLSEMLGELMRLQKRAVEENNSKVRRRIVMGLREVARGIRSHKVKLVVMANNLDHYGVIDDKLQEILDLAEENDVPVFFEFTKRALGKAIGKTIKIGVLGVQNAEGAHQQFKRLVQLAPTR